MTCFRAWLGIVCRSDNAFNGVAKDDVRDLIVSEECTDQRATVYGDHNDSF